MTNMRGTELTQAQQRLLDTCGADSLRTARALGELPDCPEVNARIAERVYWENPASWNFGRWFLADYINAQFRRGQVFVQRVVTPDGDVCWHVAAPRGRWCDSLSTEEAKKHLCARRLNGRVVEANQDEARQAYHWALGN